MIQASEYPTVGLASDQEARNDFGLGLAVGASLICIGGLWVGGESNLLRMAIPAGATLVGLVLFLTRPISYVQYSLWAWFLSPLVRRIVDWHFGYTESNLILLAPLLVSGIAILTMVIPTRRPTVRVPVAFVLCGTAIVYGFAVGVILRPSGETLYGLANWLCPLVFGLHLYLNERRHSQYYTAIGKTFLWAALILGAYGIYQFVSPPAWDLYWLENVRVNLLDPSFGQPSPFLVRVWSTMNGPGIFANTMLVLLLFLLFTRATLKTPASILGYTSLLLSVVRTAWLSWLVGLLLILKNSRSRRIFHTLLLMLILSACVFPLVSHFGLGPTITQRINTFSNLGHDESLNDRMGMYRILLNQSIHNPVGFGLNNEVSWRDTAIDSGIISLLFSLGWLGTALFSLGIVKLLLTSIRVPSQKELCIISRGIAMALLIQVVGGNIFVGATGAMFWMFIALSLGGTYESANLRARFLGGEART